MHCSMIDTPCNLYNAIEGCCRETQVYDQRLDTHNQQKTMPTMHQFGTPTLQDTTISTVLLLQLLDSL